MLSTFLLHLSTLFGGGGEGYNERGSDSNLQGIIFPKLCFNNIAMLLCYMMLRKHGNPQRKYERKYATPQATHQKTQTIIEKSVGKIKWQLLNLVPSPLYDIDSRHVVNILVASFNIVCWGWEEIWVEEGFKLLLAHYCLKNTV